MKQWTTAIVISLGALFCFSSHSDARINNFLTSDTTHSDSPRYDPFGPENAPDHNGQGSGGVITPSPYENLIQTYFTRTNADYYGVQYMLDSPLQISVGGAWSAYQAHGFGIVFKARSYGVRRTEYDPIREEYVPYYLGSFEASIDRPPRENNLRAFKLRIHAVTEPEGLSMSGVGVLASRWNLMVAGNRPLDRKLEAEATWMQVAGGYIMPLSPKKGGVNLAACGAVDLFGVKYQSYHSGIGEFVGGKIGSAGWLLGIGWNANRLVNLAGYIGGEWSFSTGGLVMPTKKIVFSDIARSSIYFGWQVTGRWFNITGGVQKEWEYLDYQNAQKSDQGHRYYAGVNVYLRP